VKNTLIRNAHIIDPSRQIDRKGSILISGDKIAWTGQDKDAPEINDCRVFETSNLIACPGFVDLHCHLREPGFEDKETIATGTAAAAKGGFTTVCCMANTNPPIDNPSVVKFVKDKASAEGSVRVLPIGCITKGRRGEELSDMKALVKAGVVAFSDDGSAVMDSDLLQKAFELSLALGVPVIEHCEDKAMVGNGQINEGKMASRLGLAGIPAAAEETIVARDIALAELTGAHLHIAHVSTAGSVSLIRDAKRRGVHVTAEVTPHHLTLTEDILQDLNTNAKVSPPLRTAKDIAALIEGLKDNTLDAIATDHAPHTEKEKASGFTSAPSGISILETALGSLMGLVHSGSLDMNLLISKLTCGPVSVIGNKYAKLGTLQEGSFADIVLFDPGLKWIVDPQKFVSRGKNTPLAGTELKGKVMATFYQGKVVYSDERLVK
jgi:dihydroorotase